MRVLFCLVLMLQGCIATPEVDSDEALLCVSDCFHVRQIRVRNQCMKHCERLDNIVKERDKYIYLDNVE